MNQKTFPDSAGCLFSHTLNHSELQVPHLPKESRCLPLEPHRAAVRLTGMVLGMFFLGGGDGF